MGLRDIERKLKINSAYQRKEAEVILQEIDQMIENVEILKEQLKKFEKEHGKEIKDNRDYYEKIALVREELGLPTEVGVYEWKDSPSLKDRMGGKGYYEELADEILKIGKSHMANTGGMISLAEIILQINKIRPGRLVSPKDVKKSLETLVDAEVIQPLRKLPSGVLIVEFIAIELSEDQQTVLDIASRKGFLTRENLILVSNWPPERATRILNEMVDNGIALKDESYHEGTKYWFPSLGQQ
ncbi:MAG: EAP30/Vps36 family vacuolar-sorting protein [Candidatus Heimdallarchaeota archaeon]|nr:EAP30/Vps36 family vacuolar-sorting protein [Candidatus Heimdallarchaeota archaeon]MDH5647205.1 EAP30/Vps36 family vacuolar-sorting protein [Candidatus Heimdallarchaeota archaeon]